MQLSASVEVLGDVMHALLRDGGQLGWEIDFWLLHNVGVFLTHPVFNFKVEASRRIHRGVVDMRRELESLLLVYNLWHVQLCHLVIVHCLDARDGDLLRLRGKGSRRCLPRPRPLELLLDSLGC